MGTFFEEIMGGKLIFWHVLTKGPMIGLNQSPIIENKLF